MICKEDYNKVIWSNLDWLVNRDLNDTEIDPKCSDNINFIRRWYP